MTPLEIFLIIIGSLLVIISYLLSEKISKKKNIESIDQNQIKLIIDEEIMAVKKELEADIEESADSALEKTERELEKVSNEKIMAVNEYSDTVLDEISKNHKELMFLYNMLNDKEERIKETTGIADKFKTEVDQLIRQAKTEIGNHTEEKHEDKKEETDTPVKNNDVENENESMMRNNNERITKLYQTGKSKLDIARELGLGVGEVQLVIDLLSRGEQK